MSSRIEALENKLTPLRASLKGHPLYRSLQSIDDVKLFSEFHVYAVFDFMSLLKALQLQFTCVSLPWLPTGSGAVARFINEIVHGEESDINEVGEPMSHFEMYLDAMKQLGASTIGMETFITALQNNKSLQEALEVANAPKAAQDFVNYTFSVVETKEAHKIAASFTFGREDVIPDMFIAILEEAKTSGHDSDKFRYYLDRHIELDGDEHGPIALKMIDTLCGDNDTLWAEAEAVAIKSLEVRIALWDGIYEAIKQPQLS
jgi:hypothetical protein